MTLFNFIQSHKELIKSEEIVFFGGSFNPWHRGHKACLELMGRNKKIIVIPDHNPLKDLSKTNFTDLSKIKSDTIELNQDIYIYDKFFKAQVKNPTSKWIQELKESGLTQKLSILMGFDSFLSLGKWIEYDYLLKNLDTIYIVNRLNESEASKDHKSLCLEYSNLNLVFLGKHEFEIISSTEIRKSL